jgi:hypothetical protein
LPQEEQEIAIIESFAEAVDVSGFPLPMPRNEIRLGLSGSGCSYWPSGQPPQEGRLALVALAQHYGIPTRLLEWTCLGRVAAYLAARETDAPTETLAVWALCSCFVTDCLIYVEGHACRVGRAPRASNPNLHAQGGLFTYCYQQEDSLLALDEIVGGASDGRLKMREYRNPIHTFDPSGYPCLMRKLELPRSEARKLMYMLQADGVSAATLFPGLSSIANYLQETTWCAPVATRTR